MQKDQHAIFNSINYFDFLNKNRSLEEVSMKGIINFITTNNKLSQNTNQLLEKLKQFTNAFKNDDISILQNTLKFCKECNPNQIDEEVHNQKDYSDSGQKQEKEDSAIKDEFESIQDQIGETNEDDHSISKEDNLSRVKNIQNKNNNSITYNISDKKLNKNNSDHKKTKTTEIDKLNEITKEQIKKMKLDNMEKQHFMKIKRHGINRINWYLSIDVNDEVLEKRWRQKNQNQVEAKQSCISQGQKQLIDKKLIEMSMTDLLECLTQLESIYLTKVNETGDYQFPQNDSSNQINHKNNLNLDNNSINEKSKIKLNRTQKLMQITTDQIKNIDLHSTEQNNFIRLKSVKERKDWYLSIILNDQFIEKRWSSKKQGQTQAKYKCISQGYKQLIDKKLIEMSMADFDECLSQLEEKQLKDVKVEELEKLEEETSRKRNLTKNMVPLAKVSEDPLQNKIGQLKVGRHCLDKITPDYIQHINLTTTSRQFFLTLKNHLKKGQNQSGTDSVNKYWVTRINKCVTEESGTGFSKKQGVIKQGFTLAKYNCVEQAQTYLTEKNVLTMSHGQLKLALQLLREKYGLFPLSTLNMNQNNNSTSKSSNFNQYDNVHHIMDKYMKTFCYNSKEDQL